MNLLLFVLNMIPLPPLDGSGALPLLLPESLATRYQDFIQQPMLGWIGLLIAWNIFDDIFMPVFFAAVQLLYPEAAYS